MCCLTDKMCDLFDSSLNPYRHSTIFQSNSGLKQSFCRSLMSFLIYCLKEMNPKVGLLHLANQLSCRAAQTFQPGETRK